MPEDEARDVVRKVVSGLCHLNTITPSVIHHDIKPGKLYWTQYSSIPIAL